MSNSDLESFFGFAAWNSPDSPSPPAPQAVVGEASEAACIMHLRDAWATLTNLSVDMEASPVRQQMQKRASAIRDFLDSVEQPDGTYALTPSPTPTAPQEADVLREALKGTVAAIEGMHGRKPEHVEAALANAKHALLAAPAQHQPQQGEQHE